MRTFLVIRELHSQIPNFAFEKSGISLKTCSTLDPATFLPDEMEGSLLSFKRYLQCFGPLSLTCCLNPSLAQIRNYSDCWPLVKEGPSSSSRKRKYLNIVKYMLEGKNDLRPSCKGYEFWRYMESIILKVSCHGAYPAEDWQMGLKDIGWWVEALACEVWKSNRATEVTQHITPHLELPFLANGNGLAFETEMTQGLTQVLCRFQSALCVAHLDITEGQKANGLPQF